MRRCWQVSGLHMRVSSEFSHLYLLLPRALVVDAGGGDFSSGRELILDLENQGLFALAYRGDRTFGADWSRAVRRGEVVQRILCCRVAFRLRHPPETSYALGGQSSVAVTTSIELSCDHVSASNANSATVQVGR